MPENCAIANTAFLLPAYDEYLISYADRKAMIRPDVQPRAISQNGIFRPIVVINGKVEGTWKKNKDKNGIGITLEPFRPLNKRQIGAIKNALASMEAFYTAPLRLCGDI